MDAALTVYVLIIVICGAFGGFVSAIFDNQIAANKSLSRHECNRCNKWYFFGRTLIGIAGSFGVVLFAGWINKIKIDLQTNNLLELMCLCVISGTISYRLLPIIGAKLQKQIDALEGKSEEQAKKIEELEEKDENTQKEIQKSFVFQDALTMSKDLLSKKEICSTSDIYATISIMEKFKHIGRFHRAYNIYLGRLYRKVKNYDNAIEVLRTYIKELDGKDRPVELTESIIKTNKGAALYNISCYHVLKAENISAISSKQEIERLFLECLRDLKESFILDPTNVECAKSEAEEDFNFLRNDASWGAKFQCLVEEAEENI